MFSKALDLDDETQLFCDIGRHGWSDLIVASKGNLRSFRVSDVFTDFPAALLEICRFAIENSALRIALYDEPGGAVCTLEPDKKQQHTMVLSIFEVDGTGVETQGKQVFALRIRRQRLVGMLMAELWKAHVSLQQPSYQKGRSSFPHKQLVALNKAWDLSELGPSFLK